MAANPSFGRVRLPELTGDARADRWREHRAGVRAELVEATLRAVEEFGPDVSIDDIVKTAGVPRPKLYRFFDDKDQLFGAVSERIQELILERMTPHLMLTGTALAAVRAALAAYVDLVDERPNLFRFLVNAHITDGDTAMELIERGRPLSDAAVGALSLALVTRGGDGEHLEYAVDAVLGAVGLGVLRWLNSPTIDKRRLVEELTVVVWGALSAAAAARGVSLSPDEPLG